MNTAPTHDSILIQVMADRSNLIRAINALLSCSVQAVRDVPEAVKADRAAREVLADIRARNTAD